MGFAALDFGTLTQSQSVLPIRIRIIQSLVPCLLWPFLLTAAVPGEGCRTVDLDPEKPRVSVVEGVDLWPLLQRIRAGDQQAAGQFYEYLQPLLLGFAFQ